MKTISQLQIEQYGKEITWERYDCIRDRNFIGIESDEDYFEISKKE